MRKNVAGQKVGVQMVTTAGLAFSGTVTVYVTKDNGTQTAGAAGTVNKGNGYYNYSPTQAETNADHVSFTFVGTGAVPQTIQIFTTSLNPQDTTNGGLTGVQVAANSSQLAYELINHISRIMFPSYTYGQFSTALSVVSTGTSTTLNLGAGTLSDYQGPAETVGWFVAVTYSDDSGSFAAGQVRRVVSVNVATGVLTVEPPWGITPQTDDQVYLGIAYPTPTAEQNADIYLGRSLAGGANGGRTVRDSLRANRNKVAFDVPSAGQFTVYEEDDTTPAWVGTYARGAAGLGPVVTIDPTG